MRPKLLSSLLTCSIAATSLLGFYGMAVAQDRKSTLPSGQPFQNLQSQIDQQAQNFQAEIERLAALIKEKCDGEQRTTFDTINIIRTAFFGPTRQCSIGVRPDLPGLTESDPNGFRLLGPNDQGCRLIFGRTMDCTIEVDPQGPPGLLLRDPRGIRIIDPTDPKQDPNRPPLPTLFFGPSDLCSISGAARQGLLLRDPGGVRVLNPFPEELPTRILFGPTDDCTIGIIPGLPGLTETDPAGFRLLGPGGQGCRLIFGPTMDCTIEVAPQGPTGLLLRDPRGIRLLNPDAALLPRLLFGPTDDCNIIGGNGGLVLTDPRGVRLINPDPEALARLVFGPTDDCNIIGGRGGLVLTDPRGVRLINPVQEAPAVLFFGPTDDCSIRTSGPGTQSKGLIVTDPFAVQVASRLLDVQGVVMAEAFSTRSSRELKENIKPIENALDKITRLQGVTFDWKNDRNRNSEIGFIAEDVAQVLPELVVQKDEGQSGLKYPNLVAVAVEGIKEQQSQIDALRRENTALKESLAMLQKQMADMASRMEHLTKVQAP